MNRTKRNGETSQRRALMVLFLAALAIVAMQGVARAGIEVDTANVSHVKYRGGPKGVSSRTWSHTVNGALPYRKLVVGVTGRDVNSKNIVVRSASYGGVPMILINRGNQDWSIERNVAGLFYLDNPPAGTATVEIKFDHHAEVIVAGAMTLYNAAPGDPVAELVRTGSAGNSALFLEPGIPNTRSVSVLALRGNNSITAIAPGVAHVNEKDNYLTNYLRGGLMSQFQSASSSVAIGWTHTSTDFVNAAAAFASMGAMTINIVGPAAARWTPDGGAHWYASGATVDLVPGDYIVSFNPQANLTSPDEILASVVSGETFSRTAVYKANLAYSAGPNGTLTGTVAQTVNYGGSGTQVIAVPDLGYQFDKWSDSATVASRTDTNVTAHKNVTAAFIERMRTISYASSPAGAGTVSGPASIQDSIGEITFTITPNPGYDLDNLTVEATSGTVTALGSGNYRLSNVKANTTVTVTFNAAEYNVSYVTDPAGTGSISGGAAVIQAVVGTTQFAVLPAAGYTTFLVTASRGAITNLGNGNYRLSDVNRDTVVTAVFVKKMRSIAYKADGEGTVTGLHSVQDTTGAVEFTVEPAPGKSFAGIDYDNTKALVEHVGGNTYRVRNVTANIQITAYFM